MVVGVCPGVCFCLSRASLSAELRVQARRVSLGGEGNALYPVLSSYYLLSSSTFLLLLLSFLLSLLLLATFPPDGRERSPVDNGLGRDARPIRQQRRR